METINKGREIESHKVKGLMDSFLSYIRSNDSNGIPTGFAKFDKAIGGGLFPKLYCIGAISSLGKTTFVLQMADGVAKGGTDVLIFSLEMSKDDIIARSISRETYILSGKNPDSKTAKTEMDITTFARWKYYGQEDKEVITKAFDVYKGYAYDHVSIYEGRQSIDDIYRIVEDYIAVTGRKPVVIVDYLQLVRPSKDMERASVKEQMDSVIDKLAEMRRTFKIPVIAISSFNRSSYNTSADNTAFKESGAIEYSADATITMELNNVTTTKINNRGRATSQDTAVVKGQIKDEMRGNAKGERSIKITFHKNRGNMVGGEIEYTYNPKFNYFEEGHSIL